MNVESRWASLVAVGLCFWNGASVWFQIEDFRQSMSSYPRFWSGLVIVIAITGLVGLLASFNRKVRFRRPKIRLYSVGTTALGAGIWLLLATTAHDPQAASASELLADLDQRLAQLEAMREAKSPDLPVQSAQVLQDIRKASAATSTLSSWNQHRFAHELSMLLSRVESISRTAEIEQVETLPGSDAQQTPPLLIDSDSEAPTETPSDPHLHPENRSAPLGSGPASLLTGAEQGDGTYAVVAPLGRVVWFSLPAPPLEHPYLFFRPSISVFTGLASPAPTLAMHPYLIKGRAQRGIFSVDGTAASAGEQWSFMVAWCLASLAVPACENPTQLAESSVTVTFSDKVDK